MNLKSLVLTYPDFPKEGIQFKDINQILANAEAFDEIIKEAFLWIKAKNIKVDMIAGVEARGFCIACPLAAFLQVGFMPIRKSGKLPGYVISEKFESEYRVESLEFQERKLKGKEVLIVDDILATGETALASIKLIESCKGNVSGLLFLGQISKLNGVSKLKNYNVNCILSL